MMCKFFLAAVSKMRDGSLAPRKHKCGTGMILRYSFQTFDAMVVGYTIILIALKNCIHETFTIET